MYECNQYHNLVHIYAKYTFYHPTMRSTNRKLLIFWSLLLTEGNSTIYFFLHSLYPKHQLNEPTKRMLSFFSREVLLPDFRAAAAAACVETLTDWRAAAEEEDCRRRELAGCQRRTIIGPTAAAAVCRSTSSTNGPGPNRR